ncbi:MAG: hypothetical protein Q8L48_30905 [Archangium sp.]|nr:hypothetical protein [Archangium sp.]
MRRAFVVLVVAAACGPVNPAPDASVDDAGVSDAGPIDAGFDAGFQILERRDAGPLLTDTGLPWSWASVEAVISIAPAAGTVRGRWVPIFPVAVDRAWSGGVLLFDGGVVAIPFNEPSVLVIHPTDDTFVRWPIDGGAVAEGWEGGVLLPDGQVIAIPRNAARFLRIDPFAGTATPFGDDLSDASDGGLGKFRGGVLGLNGLVYAAPSQATFVARLDPSTGRVTRLPVPRPFVIGSTQGAVLFPTGDIVMFPSADTPGLLVIPSRDGGVDEVWLLPRPAPLGLSAFTGGGLITGVETAMAPPQQNSSQLEYEAGLFRWAPEVPGLPAQAANTYLFGAWSTDGRRYFPPYGTEDVLRASGRGAQQVPLDAGVALFRGVLGAVGLPDGRVIGIPHSRSAWLELTPDGRRTVSMEAMTSPFLNKL